MEKQKRDEIFANLCSYAELGSLPVPGDEEKKALIRSATGLSPYRQVAAEFVGRFCQRLQDVTRSFQAAQGDLNHETLPIEVRQFYGVLRDWGEQPQDLLSPPPASGLRQLWEVFSETFYQGYLKEQVMQFIDRGKLIVEQSEKFWSDFGNLERDAESFHKNLTVYHKHNQNRLDLPLPDWEEFQQSIQQVRAEGDLHPSEALAERLAAQEQTIARLLIQSALIARLRGQGQQQ